VGIKVSGWLLAAALAAPAPAQEQVAARGFLAHVYVAKTSGRYFNFASPRLLTPDLYDLVQRRGDALENDPLCQCRDNDGLSAEILSVTGTANQAVARVLLRYDGTAPPQRVTLMLRRSAAGWKIADIASARVPSLKARLARGTRLHRAAR
jgi:hypothetical protein